MAPAFQPPYAIPVPGAVQKEGETVPHRHFKFADKLVDHPEDVYTLWDMYLHGYKLAGGRFILVDQCACTNTYDNSFHRQTLHGYPPYREWCCQRIRLAKSSRNLQAHRKLW